MIARGIVIRSSVVDDRRDGTSTLDAMHGAWSMHHTAAEAAMSPMRPRQYFPHILLFFGIVAAASAGRPKPEQTLAPQEQGSELAPAAIIWAPPEVPKGPIEFESAEQRKLRLVVM